MEEREEITKEQMTREIEASDEADEAYTDTLHRAEKAQIILSHYIEAQGIQRDYDTLVAISDPAVGEYEKDCAKL